MNQHPRRDSEPPESANSPGRREAAKLAEVVAAQPWQETGVLSLRGLGLRALPAEPPVASVLLPRLCALDLSGNRLTDLPEWLWELPALETLAAAGNRLQSIDPQLGRLAVLRDLDLSYNRLSALPLSIADCVALRRVDLSGNKLSELSTLAELRALVLLDAADNRIERVEQLPAPHTLRSLDLSGNRLTTLSTAFRGLRVLRRLDLSGNRLTSSALRILEELPIEELYLDDNALERLVETTRMPRLRRLSALDNPMAASTTPPSGGPSQGGSNMAAWEASEVIERFISGGADPGRSYFDQPPYALNATLAVDGPRDARRVVDLYYKRFTQISPSLTFDDGLSINLGSLNRGSALSYVQTHQPPGTMAWIQLPPTRDPDVLLRSTAFLAQAIARVDRPALVSENVDESDVVFQQTELTSPARVLNVAVTDERRQILPSSQVLAPDVLYLLRIAIGPVADDTIVINPTLIRPEDLAATTSDGYWFDVVVASSDVDVPEGVRRLFLPFNGSSWVCDCPGPNHTCNPRDRLTYLHVPVHTRSRTGPMILRCTVYNGMNAIQSVRVDVRVGPPGTSGIIRGEVDFALAEDAARAGDLPPRHLNVLTNDAGSGTHTIVVNSGERVVSVSINETETANVVNAIRGKLSEVTLGRDGASPQYDSANRKGFRSFVQDLKQLALVGSMLWGAVVPDRDDRRYLRMHLGSRANIQIARVTRTVFPWALVYDIPRELAATWTMCPLLEDWEANLNRIMEYPDGCPYRDAHQINVLCPYGFWGFRHLIEQPVSVRNGVLRTRINVIKPAHAATARSLALDARLAEAHFAELASCLSSRFQILACDSRDTVRQAFTNPRLPLVYFYCHGKKALLAGTQLAVPFLEIGTADRIGPTDFAAWDEAGDWGPAHWTTTAPLVFINGCETAMLVPEDVVSFVDALVGMNAAGVVGTEIPVTQQVAGEIALRFYQWFAGESNVSVGIALHRARIELLCKGNLSGLVYTPFCSMDLTLESTP